MNDRTVTQLLQDLRGGDPQAVGMLVPRVYDSLRKLAGHMIRGERQDHTLQATAIVHECYMELVDMLVDWQDRAHFLRSRLARCGASWLIMHAPVAAKSAVVICIDRHSMMYW
jgi:hypothetical protein